MPITTQLFTGAEGSALKLGTAQAATQAYRQNPLGKTKALFVGFEVVRTILAQPDCVGMIFYHAYNEDGNLRFVTTGCTETSAGWLGDLIGDYGKGCPPDCDFYNEAGLSLLMTEAEYDAFQRQPLKPKAPHFTGAEGGFISAATAGAWVNNFQRAHPGVAQGFFFGRQLIEQILAQPTCMGVRQYYCVAPDGTRSMLLVGSNAAGMDLTQGLIAGEGIPVQTSLGTAVPAPMVGKHKSKAHA
ncbi:hypothetical protein [Hymenobacter crusticola]|uniref:Uncharacterized protein n=1 Tax=Hymenobacter crusticola TaxID=1770526 RepID=A0A243W7A2_9BACT|nr:hypothetical protein [Hymenobacter crusticola]OUJ67409.1 hypothetical protein BXP70_28840 [Hymenobacter crusticola]